jgi:hypothetical protein
MALNHVLGIYHRFDDPDELHGRRGGGSSLLGACNFMQIELYIERPKPLKCHTEHEKGFPKKMSLILTCFHHIVLGFLGSMLNLQGVAV